MNNLHKTGPKDVFVQLLSIIWLYVSVGFFGALLFGLINIYFPDISRFDYGSAANRALKMPLAVLVVVFPLYLWLTSYIQKDLVKNPAKKELKTRKWLLYFTVTATSIAIVIDLISVVYKFLDGDLTTQFILKVLAVLTIAGAVFTYYLWIIKKDTPPLKHPKMKWFVCSVVVLGGLFIIIGFLNAGSPASERMRRFDERRVRDLASIQLQITNYWQAKETLPKNLDQLHDNIRGFVPPKDPETNESYKYTVVDKTTFELCSTFNTSNKDIETSIGVEKPIPAPTRGGYYLTSNESWQHDKGETCFERTIDPDLYPPLRDIN